jgi:hypothetical protein
MMLMNVRFSRQENKALYLHLKRVTAFIPMKKQPTSTMAAHLVNEVKEDTPVFLMLGTGTPA